MRAPLAAGPTPLPRDHRPDTAGRDASPRAAYCRSSAETAWTGTPDRRRSTKPSTSTCTAPQPCVFIRAAPQLPSIVPCGCGRARRRSGSRVAASHAHVPPLFPNPGRPTSAARFQGCPRRSAPTRPRLGADSADRLLRGRGLALEAASQSSNARPLSESARSEPRRRPMPRCSRHLDSPRTDRAVTSASRIRQASRSSC